MQVLNNVSFRRGVKLVLDQASVVLQPGEKVGLVGRNGAGKSSLFSLLTHRLQSDAGDVQRCRRAGALAKLLRKCPRPIRARPNSCSKATPA